MTEIRITNIGSIKNVVSFGQTLKQIVGKDTSADPDNWSESNPFWGQCAVAALLFQDVFGGILVNAKVQLNGISHYWNVLPNGAEVDMTGEQFPFTPIFIDQTYKKQRDYVLSFPQTRSRYEILRRRYEAIRLEKTERTEG